MQDIINLFLSQRNYDIRISKDARWIDQKCTYDNINMIADSVLEFINDDIQKEFTIRDIWNSKYAQENIQNIFLKPNPSNKSTHEYDKYFSQPIKLLSYSGVLNSIKINDNRYKFSVNNVELLKYIALRPTNALNFLISYIAKVLKDSGIYQYFDDLFKNQDMITYENLKENFTNFTIKNTGIKKPVECGRSCSKVLNPLAFHLKKRGTIRGRLSDNLITIQDLTYNRLNWRDELSGKSKNIPRSEYLQSSDLIDTTPYSAYLVQKAKKDIRNYVQIHNGGYSEVVQSTEMLLATQIHHIFTQSEYPEIAHYLENLIALTANQHFLMAHPNNKTYIIDSDFQYICLIAKCTSIMKSLTEENHGNSGNSFYSFENFKFVLNTGFKTNQFENIDNFSDLIKKIDSMCQFNSVSKYAVLVKDNYPQV